MDTRNNSLAASNFVEESSFTSVRIRRWDNVVGQAIGLNGGEEVSIIEAIDDPRESSASVLRLGEP